MAPVRYALALFVLLFFLRPAAAQTLTLDASDALCNGSADGSIDLTVTGGTPPLTFLWSNGSEQEDINNLQPATYTVTVTDNTGSTATGSATIGQPAALNTGTDVTNVRCMGEQNGSIALTVTGGTAPYSFSWSVGPHSQNLNGQRAGLYTVTITDANACTATSSATVAEPGILSWGAGTTPPACSGSATGLIDLQTLGGTAPYSYYWSDGATSEDRSALLPGIYGLTIVDAQNCLLPASFNMYPTQNMSMQMQTSSSSCGGADGTIDITSVSGGTEPYTYAWSNGNTTPQAHNLATGTYTVTVTDFNGCSISASNDIAHLLVYIFPIASGCSYNLSVSASNGTAPYMYLWSNGANTPQQNVPAGSYSLTVIDANGCSAVSTVDLAPFPTLIAGITPIPDICTGGLLARGLNFTGSSYVWSNGINAAQINNIPVGTYTVTITSQQGCTASATITTTQAYASYPYSTIQSSTIQPTCPNPNGGAITVSPVTGNAPPYSYLWSTGVTNPVLTNIPTGHYWLTISNANGCTHVFHSFLLEPTPPVIVLDANTPIACNGIGNINISVTGVSGSLTYQWSNGSSTQDIQVFSPGLYMVTVTANNGCFATATYVVTQEPFPVVTINPISNDCNQAVLQPVIGGQGPFQHLWAGPNGFTSNAPAITVTLSGTYSLTITLSTGCTAISTYVVELGDGGPCGDIEGVVLYDLDSNCVVNTGEFGLWNWLVRASNATDTIYGTTDLQGHYLIAAPAGIYTLEALPPNGLWETCSGTPPVTVTENGTIQADTILVQGVLPCPALTVSIGTSILRRCFSNNSYLVQYCNSGTVAAPGAYILVTLDPFLIPVFSNVPYTDLGGGILRFDVGTVDVGECGSFQVQVQVSCNAVIGQTHCTEAHIYPDGDCLPVDLAWSGASLRLSSQCHPDSVHFIIKNIGAGDMPGESDYIVVEDAVMLMTVPFQLAAGDSTEVVLPANGSTWRVELDQEPFHPGLSAPALSVEGCGNTVPFSTGFITQFPNDEADAWIDIDCTENVGSYDPNDKQGFPVGYGPEHYIRPGTELEYMIRFQNTGTDTAFTVRIADTLSSWLDPATIRPGVSSHPYQFNLSGPGIAEFLFENILLPDSNVNQAGSNGFVKFSIYPKADAPLETVIENTAHIYFDFNEAVVTNTTRHRLGEHFLIVGLWQPQRPEYEVTVSPNPFGETAVLEVKGLTSSLPVHLQVIDLQGRVVHEETAPGPVLTLRKAGLPGGMYLFKLDQKGILVGSGKLVVKE